MSRRPSVCLVLFALAAGACAQVSAGAAGRGTWHVAGQLGMDYRLPVSESTYVEEGSLTLNVSPRVLWFPVDGLGVGADADFYYFGSHFTDLGYGIGPRVAWYLRRPGRESQLMPHAGCSFQFVMDDVSPGAIETGWSLKLGLGVSPVVGHVAVPVELGYTLERLSSDDYSGEAVTRAAARVYLESGIGAFLWRR